MGLSKEDVLMKYDVRCGTADSTLKVSTCTIICQDSEAKAFMKAVNKELRRMEAERKRNLAKGLKEGIRATPHAFLHKDGNQFSFDTFHFEDICTAAESLGKQRMRVRNSIFAPAFEITPEHVETFERAIILQKQK